MYEKYAGTRVSTKNHAHEKNEEKKNQHQNEERKKKSKQKSSVFEAACVR